MIKVNTRDQITKSYTEPIVRRLAQQAREQVIENFCMQQCHKAPHGRFCQEAKLVLYQVLHLLIEEQGKLN